MLEQRIQQQFFDSADLKYAAAEILSKPIADAVSALVGCITAGGKVLSCGNGGSASSNRCAGSSATWSGLWQHSSPWNCSSAMARPKRTP